MKGKTVFLISLICLTTIFSFTQLSENTIQIDSYHELQTDYTPKEYVYVPIQCLNEDNTAYDIECYNDFYEVNDGNS